MEASRPGAGSPSRKTAPGRFFHGEEIYLAHRQIRVFVGRGGPERMVERFELGRHSWGEVLDAARTVPLFSTGPRLVVAEAPPRAGERGKTASSSDRLSEGDKSALRGYFESPPPDTVLVMIFPGKLRRNSALLKFFSTMPGNAVQVEECKPLKGRRLENWINERLSEAGKTADTQAVTRLIELAGIDLRRLEREIEKAAVYLGDRDYLELADIDDICGAVRSSTEYELSDQLDQADFRGLVVTLDRMLHREGVEPVRIMGLVANFFRDILLARLRLREGRSRKEIFAEIKPYIRESYQNLYSRQFQLLFASAESLDREKLESLLMDLESIDRQVKSTGLPFNILMEEFLLRYCLLRKGKRATWRAWG